MFDETISGTLISLDRERSKFSGKMSSIVVTKKAKHNHRFLTIYRNRVTKRLYITAMDNRPVFAALLHTHNSFVARSLLDSKDTPEDTTFNYFLKYYSVYVDFFFLILPSHPNLLPLVTTVDCFILFWSTIITSLNFYWTRFNLLGWFLFNLYIL